MKSFPSIACCVLFAWLGLPSLAQPQETEAQIQARLASRQATIRVLKTAGKLGENAVGYIDPVKDVQSILDEVLEHDGKKITVKDFLAAENGDRKAVYGLIADRESTGDSRVTVEFVAERSAAVLLRKAEPGDWYKDKDGRWIQKPKRRD